MEGWKGMAVLAVNDCATSETVAVSRGGIGFTDGGCGGWLSM
jgi:hypothetical protein